MGAPTPQGCKSDSQGVLEETVALFFVEGKLAKLS